MKGLDLRSPVTRSTTSVLSKNVEEEAYAATENALLFGWAALRPSAPVARARLHAGRKRRAPARAACIVLSEENPRLPDVFPDPFPGYCAEFGTSPRQKERGRGAEISVFSQKLLNYYVFTKSPLPALRCHEKKVEREKACCILLK